MTRNDAYNRLRDAGKLPALPERYLWVVDEAWGGDPTIELGRDDFKAQLQRDGDIEIEVDVERHGTHYVYLALDIVNALVKARDMIDAMEKQV